MTGDRGAGTSLGCVLKLPAVDDASVEQDISYYKETGHVPRHLTATQLETRKPRKLVRRQIPAELTETTIKKRKRRKERNDRRARAVENASPQQWASKLPDLTIPLNGTPRSSTDYRVPLFKLEDGTMIPMDVAFVSHRHRLGDIEVSAMRGRRKAA